MYTNIKLWSLSYASVSDDDDLYVETIGLYDSYDKAAKALKEYVASEIREGDDEDNWDVHEDQADYTEESSPHTRKALMIESF